MGRTPPTFNILTVVNPPPAPPAKPELLDRVRQAIRTRHYSYHTEKAYVGWINRFIFFFHNKRHPAEMGKVEAAVFAARSMAWPSLPMAAHWGAILTIAAVFDRSRCLR